MKWIAAMAAEVTCEGEAGKCIVENDFSRCECLRYGSSISESSIESVSGEPAPEKSVEELQAECEMLLVEDCGDSVPVPSEECEEGALADCSAWFMMLESYEEECSPDDEDDDWGEEVRVDNPTDEGTVGRGLTVWGVDNDDVVAVEPNPWDVVDCCEQLAEETEIKAMMDEALTCLATLETADCQARTACLDESGLGAGEDSRGDSVISKGDSEQEGIQTPPPESSHSQGTAGTGSDGDEVGGDGETEETADDDDDDGSGCRISPTRKRDSRSLFSLLALILG